MGYMYDENQSRQFPPPGGCAVRAEVYLEIEELSMDRQKKKIQAEIQTECVKMEKMELDMAKSRLERTRTEFETEKLNKKKNVLQEVQNLYELERQIIIDRKDPDVIDQLDKAFKKLKARIDEIESGSLWFGISFRTEKDMQFFCQKYEAGR
ncbi:uncharacterized protein LOC144433060 [Glandiceps talaboti]